MNNRIRAICVGGTIDKIYFDANSKYEIGAPALAKILQQMPIHLDIKLTSLMAKDSLDMSDDDRALIKHAVNNCEQKRIIITHGTDTMTDTAAALGKQTDKTIVLTGALQPSVFKETDALLNVGGALAAVQTLAPGVYIVMNGEVFDAHSVKKDVANQRFVRTET